HRARQRWLETAFCARSGSLTGSILRMTRAISSALAPFALASRRRRYITRCASSYPVIPSDQGTSSATSGFASGSVIGVLPLRWASARALAVGAVGILEPTAVLYTRIQAARAWR